GVQTCALPISERTGEKRALATRKPVDVLGLLRVVPAHETVQRELALDGLDRPDHPGVLRWEEAHDRDHEHAGVELLRAVVLREGVAIGVEALLAHLF